jgi:single-strand DNA-binding protein
MLAILFGKNGMQKLKNGDFTREMEVHYDEDALKRKGGMCRNMINQVVLVGRLTKDPELRYTADGAAVANVTLAVTRNFRNAEGGIDTDFVQCTLWRKVAENTANYCRKGSIIGVMGRIQTRSYEKKDGQRVFVTEVVAESVRFMGGKTHEWIEHS